MGSFFCAGDQGLSTNENEENRKLNEEMGPTSIFNEISNVLKQFRTFKGSCSSS